MKLETNSVESIVIDVTNVSRNVNDNETTLTLDKRYINQAMNVFCVYDKDNIFHLEPGIHGANMKT